jgi:hypothetical protein
MLEPLALISSSFAENYFLGLNLIKTKRFRIDIFTSEKKKIVPISGFKSVSPNAPTLGRRFV